MATSKPNSSPANQLANEKYIELALEAVGLKEDRYLGVLFSGEGDFDALMEALQPSGIQRRPAKLINLRDQIEERSTARSRGRRQFLGPKLGAGGRNGEAFGGLTLQRVLDDPKLKPLGLEVLDQLNEQFSRNKKDDAADVPPDGAADGSNSLEEIDAYRAKLKFWSTMLETLLEETLEEHERMHDKLY